MRVRIVIPLLSTLLAMIAIEGKSQCSVIQDQVDTYLYTDQDFGQSFTVCQSGLLKQIDIATHHFLNGDIQAHLSIFEGEGYDGALIYSQEITLPDDWGSTFSHLLNDAISVEQDSMYTLKVDYVGEYGAVWANFTEVYDDGSFLWNGSLQETIDMGFIVHIEPSELGECIVWNGTVSQEWSDPYNWTPAIVPDSTDCVNISVTDTGMYPIITDLARTGDLFVETSGALAMTDEAILHVHGNLDSYGQTLYQGEVILEQGTLLSEINGSPVFNHLTIKGLLYTTEPIEVLDILDLREGYLANFGSELYLNSGDGHAGHAYIPNELIAGPIIIKKHLEQSGEQLIGLPFFTSNELSMFIENMESQILTFDQTQGIENFEANWTISPEFEPQDLCDVLRTNTDEAVIYLKGETSNEELTISGSSDDLNGEAKLHLVANPYPSVIDLDGLEITGGSNKATYKWLPEKQQFGSRSGGYSTHGMNNRLYPTEAFMIELGVAENITFNYSASSLLPSQIYVEQEETVILDPMIRLEINAPHGVDEFMIRLDNNASFGMDAEADALKIPSLNPLMPTSGSVSSDNEVLSINAMPYPEQGTVLPLYIQPGQEGELIFNALMMNVGGIYDHIFIHDKKHQIYHDLIGTGMYETQCSLHDDVNRFELQFGLSSPFDDHEGFDSYAVMDIQSDSSANNDWEISSYQQELSVSSISSNNEEVHIRVHSLDGKLVFDRRVTVDQGQWQEELHIDSGIYLITVSNGSVSMTERVWLD